MISRRQFLRGDFSGKRIEASAPGGGPVITVARICLAYSNVVCRTCGEACDTGAIRFSPRLGGAAAPEIDAAKCTACGECVTKCPAQAITLV